MSYCRILAAKEDGQLEHFKMFSNSYGFLMLVWETLFTKYRDQVDPNEKILFGDRYPALWKWVQSGGPPRWSSQEQKNIPAQLRSWELNVLYLTYDMTYIHGKEQLLRFAESCRIFSESNSSSATRVDHLHDIADETERLANEGYVYLCFYGMSVAENLWEGSITVKVDSDDEEDEYEDEESISYNFKENPENARFEHEPTLRPMVEVDRRGWCTP